MIDSGKNWNVAGMMKCHLSVFVTWTYGMHGIDAADLHTDQSSIYGLLTLYSWL